MKKIKLSIDGFDIITTKGKTVLEAALENHIYIPHLCYHPDLKPVGVCRVCMVEIGERPVVSCMTPAEEGMAVVTQSEAIDKIRRMAVELLITDHESDCLSCAGDSECALQKAADYVGIDQARLKRLRSFDKKLPIDTSNPFFEFNPNKCILCGICVRTCSEIQGLGAIDFTGRGYDTRIGTFIDQLWGDSTCESCGECLVRCPTGALSLKEKQKPSRMVKTTCPYCGVGCSIYLGMRGNEIVAVTGDRQCPVNKGHLCVKGRFGQGFVNHPQRLKTPLIKRNGVFEEATWEQALEKIAKGFKKYQRKGKFAVVSSAKCTNEENYLIQKFARAVMGTNNVDHCARLCHAPTVAGLVQNFGSGAMTNSINEIKGAACILAIGTNTTEAHPVIGAKIRQAVAKGTKLIVANPLEISLCRPADIFIQHRAGTDVALLMGLMRVIVDEGLHDTEFIKQRCENFEEFKASLKDFDLDTVEKITTVPREKIIAAARMYANVKPGMILYSMGITQHSHGTDNVLATGNLAMLTGNIGKPSTGVNPLRGQNNVQGACDLGALPNVYSGYQKVDDPKVHKKFEKAWGAELDDKKGLTLTEMFPAVDMGKIKAMYLVGENPVLSDADASHVKEAIEKLEFLVVQDIFLTETALLADVVLPAATFAEKDGTFTNTERRVQRVRRAVKPVGNSRPDWQITCNIARAMGAKGFDFDSPAAVMDEITALTPIYGGIAYKRLEKQGLQWPCPDEKHPGTLFLHKEKFSRGKGRFIPLQYKPSVELPDKEYPLLLTTGRSLYHFHTGTMTRKVKGLEQLKSCEMLELNQQDADNLKFKDGEQVRVISRRGQVTARAKITRACPPGTVFMTFHFRETPTNILTSPALDPVAKIPETKVCAVRVEKVKTPPKHFISQLEKK